MGVVKLFVPPDSACYECGMTEMDYKLINLRYSCPLLKREDILEGKTPTTPTISSITAGLQTQEALKLLHGSQVQKGAAHIFNGTGNTFYTTQFSRRDDCLSHLQYSDIRDLQVRSNYTLKTFFEAVRHQLKLQGPLELVLDRELLVRFACRTCGREQEVMKLQMDVTVKQGLCPTCQTQMLADTTHSIASDSKYDRLTLEQIGVPPYDIVRVRCGNAVHPVALAADREKVIAWPVKK
jgi:adenylyltransferase/sulfurtransferase